MRGRRVFFLWYGLHAYTGEAEGNGPSDVLGMITLRVFLSELPGLGCD